VRAENCVMYYINYLCDKTRLTNKSTLCSIVAMATKAVQHGLAGTIKVCDREEKKRVFSQETEPSYAKDCYRPRSILCGPNTTSKNLRYQWHHSDHVTVLVQISDAAVSHRVRNRDQPASRATGMPMKVEQSLIERVMKRIVSESQVISESHGPIYEDTDLYKAGLLDSLGLAHLIRALEIDLEQPVNTRKLFSEEVKSPAQIASLFVAE